MTIAKLTPRCKVHAFLRIYSINREGEREKERKKIYKCADIREEYTATSIAIRNGGTVYLCVLYTALRFILYCWLVIVVITILRV